MLTEKFVVKLITASPPNLPNFVTLTPDIQVKIREKTSEQSAQCPLIAYLFYILSGCKDLGGPEGAKTKQLIHDLIQSGAKVNVCDHHHVPILLRAMQLGEKALVNELLRAGALLTFRDFHHCDIATSLTLYREHWVDVENKQVIVRVGETQLYFRLPVLGMASMPLDKTKLLIADYIATINDHRDQQRSNFGYIDQIKQVNPKLCQNSKMGKYLTALVRLRHWFIIGEANLAGNLMRTGFWSDALINKDEPRYHRIFDENKRYWIVATYRRMLDTFFHLFRNQEARIADYLKQHLKTLPSYIDQIEPLRVLFGYYGKYRIGCLTRAGNCDVRAAGALFELLSLGVSQRLELLNMGDNHHFCIVIGRDQATPLTHPKRWNQDAVIFDAYKHVVFPVSEYYGQYYHLYFPYNTEGFTLKFVIPKRDKDTAELKRDYAQLEALFETIWHDVLEVDQALAKLDDEKRPNPKFQCKGQSL